MVRASLSRKNTDGHDMYIPRSSLHMIFPSRKTDLGMILYVESFDGKFSSFARIFCNEDSENYLIAPNLSRKLHLQFGEYTRPLILKVPQEQVVHRIASEVEVTRIRGSEYPSNICENLAFDEYFSVARLLEVGDIISISSHTMQNAHIGQISTSSNLKTLNYLVSRMSLDTSPGGLSSSIVVAEVSKDHTMITISGQVTRRVPYRQVHRFLEWKCLDLHPMDSFSGPQESSIDSSVQFELRLQSHEFQQVVNSPYMNYLQQSTLHNDSRDIVGTDSIFNFPVAVECISEYGTSSLSPIHSSLARNSNN
jgi:hypothetical protein